MKIVIKNAETVTKSVMEINLSSNYFKQIKQNYKDAKMLTISFSDLNLGSNIYGSSKKETKNLQKENCKIVIKLYRRTLRVIRFLKLKRVKFDGTIYIQGLTERKNNNVIMLELMLNCKLSRLFPQRLTAAIDGACTYLDAENSEHNMCDFKENSCAKHRAMGFTRKTGCCPASCKFMQCGPCKTKNISCKLIMCDYLENKGYYFSPHSLAILKVNLTYPERLSTIGFFFKSTKKTHFLIWLVRLLSILVLFCVGLFIYSLFT